MGYSLGDDKKSFDIFDKTISIHKKICEELIKNNWIFDEKKHNFSKDNRKLTLALSTDHITSVYIHDNSVDWEKFSKHNDGFEAIYGDDKIECVETDLYDTTNIQKLVKIIEYAPLLEKDLDYTPLEY